MVAAIKTTFEGNREPVANTAEIEVLVEHIICLGIVFNLHEVAHRSDMIGILLCALTTGEFL